MSLKTELKEVLSSQIEELKKLNAGTEEYESAVEAISKLTDRLVALEKLEQDQVLKGEEIRVKEEDLDMQYLKLEEEEKQRKWTTGVAIGTTLVGAGVTVWGALKAWEFEETGMVTSGPGRKFLDKLLNFKK